MMICLRRWRLLRLRDTFSPFFKTIEEHISEHVVSLGNGLLTTPCSGPAEGTPEEVRYQRCHSIHRLRLE